MLSSFRWRRNSCDWVYWGRSELWSWNTLKIYIQIVSLITFCTFVPVKGTFTKRIREDTLLFDWVIVVPSVTKRLDLWVNERLSCWLIRKLCSWLYLRLSLYRNRRISDRIGLWMKERLCLWLSWHYNWLDWYCDWLNWWLCQRLSYR